MTSPETGTRDDVNESDARHSHHCRRYDDKNERLLQWRMDPRQSYSDVTLIVTTTTNDDDDDDNDDRRDDETTTTTVFNLHKSFLAAGPRRCEFFIGLLRQHNFFIEGKMFGSNNNSIILPLKLHHQLASIAFPIMLDYVYGGTEAIQLQINTQTAIPLYYLADYYGVQGLKQVAATFWNNDMSIVNVATYYEHYQVFGYEEIRQAIIELCVDKFQSHIMVIDPTTTTNVVNSIIQATDASFWIDVFDTYLINHPDLCNGQQNCSQLPCELIRIICRSYYMHNNNNINTNNTTKITPTQFQMLTSRKYLPRICCYSHAIGFLNIEYSIVGIGDDGSDSDDGGARMEHELTCLQKRCLEVLCNDYESLVIDEDENLVIELLHNQHPLLLARFIVDSLQEATNESNVRQTKLRFARDQALATVNSLKRQLQHEKNRADTYERENKRLKQNNNNNNNKSSSSWWPTWW